MGCHWVGFDVGKACHWVCVLDDAGKVLLHRRVDATQEQIEDVLDEIEQLATTGNRRVAIDLRGDLATMLEACLLARGESVYHLPGVAVNRYRDAYAGAEQKSDARDSWLIADQLRLRWRSLRPVTATEEYLAELKVLASYRRDLVQEQTRKLLRLRALLVELCPGLEAELNFKRNGPFVALSRVASPAAVRRLGHKRLARWLKARGVYRAEKVASTFVSAAKAQSVELPASELKAQIVSELARQILELREQALTMEQRMARIVAETPVGQLVLSLPGMGTILTAEFLAETGDLSRFASADHLAAASGIAPVLRASGSTSFRRRPKRGNKVLKRVFYLSAYCSLYASAESRAYYGRKRAEGKTHRQAVVALARRRVNVLWAMLRDGQPYREKPSKAA